MIIRETMAEYQARKAVSASMLWDMIVECPAIAHHNSVFNPNFTPKNSLEFDIGTATHLLALEGKDFAARASLIAYDTYHTAEARTLRDECYAAGRTPLRPKDYQLVIALHDALRANPAASLLLFDEEGDNEVSYTWEWNGVPCKARPDRITRNPLTIVDLKTVASASPLAFQRAIGSYGHHVRTAFYLDGWNQQRVAEVIHDYRFVVVAKSSPHPAEVYRCGPRSIEWGRRLYRKALTEVRYSQEEHIWPGYNSEPVTTIELATYSERQLSDMEARDEL